MKSLKAIALFFAGCLFAFSLEFLFVQMGVINSTNYNTSILASLLMLVSLATYILMEPGYDLKELNLALDAIHQRQEQIKSEAFNSHQNNTYSELYREYDKLRGEAAGIQLEITKRRMKIGNQLKISIA